MVQIVQIMGIVKQDARARNTCGASPALGTHYALNLKAQDARGER